MTRRRSDEGATAVEMALVLPIVLTLLGGIATFALTMLYSGLAEYAARSGLRTAVVYSPSGYADQPTVKTAVNGLIPVSLLSNPTSVVLSSSTPSGASTPGQGDVVTVTVTYSVPGISTAADLMPTATLKNALSSLATITRKATGRRE